jgi:hypothetical protein
MCDDTIDLIREQVGAYRSMSTSLSAYDPVSSIHAGDVAVLLDAYDALLAIKSCKPPKGESNV